jgi:inositol phosphorylceramide mannosyltransferase catalytic subunit
MAIPKRIIQTGKSAQLPLRSRAITSNIKLLNSDFEYRFFDDEQVWSFMRQEFPQHLQMFESFPYPIQRFDLFRYLAIYRYGGFYFDLDVLLASSVSSLLQHRCVFPFEALSLNRFIREHHHMNWELGNYAFAAVAGHPFLEAVVANCVRAQKEPAWVKKILRGFPPLLRTGYHILSTTGPGIVSITFAEHPELAKDVTVLSPDDICDSQTWNHFGEYGIHVGEGTWRRDKSWLRRRAENYWETWTSRRLAKKISRNARASGAEPIVTRAHS